MSIQKIIQELINKNPLEMKEAIAEELRARVALALEAKMKDHEEDEDDEDDDMKESFDLSNYTVEELEDFMVSEEFEQLDELSKKKLGNYIKAASADASLKRMKSDRLNTAASSGKISQGEFQALDRGANNLYKSSQNRLRGIAKATDRLTKEEVELDESWSKGASSANRSDAIAAAKHQADADRLRKAANKLGKDNPQHNELMGDHHKAMAKFVKHSFHSGKYPSMAIAKKDYNSHMDQAKEYSSAT